MQLSPAAKKNLLIISALLVLGFIIFFPVLNNGFISDDYHSLYRVLVKKQFLYREFLRPLIDASFWLNYQVSGLHAWSYYLLNLLIHGATTWVLYRLALRMQFFEAGRQESFSLLSAFLFFIYPFHGESIFWLTGRLSSIATFCGLLILYWASDPRGPWRLFIPSVLLYWFALLGYESIILMPMMLLVWTYTGWKNRKNSVLLFGAWMLATLAYLLARKLISGNIAAEYGSRIFAPEQWWHAAVQFVKTLGRLFLPPQNNTRLAIGLFLLLMAVLAFLHRHLFHIRRAWSQAPVRQYLSLLATLLISLVLPVLFGLSTRTSEGDRLLYLPSAFLCLAIAYGILCIRIKRIRWTVLILVSVYFSFFLYRQRQSWERSSGIASGLLKHIQSGAAPEIIVNLPLSENGAFIFPAETREVMAVHEIDSGRVSIWNTLPDAGKYRLTPEKTPQGYFIPPATHIAYHGNELILTDSLGKTETWNRTTTLYFWNGQGLEKLNLE